MKGFLRFILGVLFIVSSFLFLALVSVRLTLLNAQFLSTALKQGNVYKELANSLNQSFQQFQKLPFQQELTSASEEKLQNAGETNIQRLLSYFQGENDTLLFYLPLAELGIPKIFLSQPPFSQFSASTTIDTILIAFNQKPEFIRSTKEVLTIIKQLLTLLPIILPSVLLFSLVTLAGFCFLAKSTSHRIRETSVLLLITGLLAALISTGAINIADSMLKNIAPTTPWLGVLISSFFSGFFTFGQKVGIIVLVIGVIGIGVHSYLIRSGKIKEEKEEIVEGKKEAAAPESKSNKRKIVIGVGIAILVAILATAGKFNFKASKTQDNQPELKVETKANQELQKTLKLTEKPYESEFGWKINYPQGWEVKKYDEKKTVIFFKKSEDRQTNINNWAFLAVENISRAAAVDKGVYLPAMTKVFKTEAKRFPNLKFAEEPKEDLWKSWKRFKFVFDYDDEKGNKVRRVWIDLFPEKGDGFLLYAETPTVSWQKYNLILMKAMETFVAGTTQVNQAGFSYFIPNGWRDFTKEDAQKIPKDAIVFLASDQKENVSASEFFISRYEYKNDDVNAFVKKYLAAPFRNNYKEITWQGRKAYSWKKEYPVGEKDTLMMGTLIIDEKALWELLGYIAKDLPRDMLQQRTKDTEEIIASFRLN